MSATEPVSRPTMRIGDEERGRVADLLSDHLATGTITQDEFADRVGLVLGARNTSDLGRAVADLPLVTQHGQAPSTHPAVATAQRQIVVSGAMTGWIAGGLVTCGVVAFGAAIALANNWVVLTLVLIAVAAVAGIAAGLRAGRSPH